MGIGKAIWGAICTAVCGLLTYLSGNLFVKLFFFEVVGGLTQWELLLTFLSGVGMLVFGFFTLVFLYYTIVGLFD